MRTRIISKAVNYPIKRKEKDGKGGGKRQRKEGRIEVGDR